MAEKTKAVATLEEYKLISYTPDAFRGLLERAAGPGGKLEPRTDLSLITTPTGGSSSWDVPTLRGDESMKTITGIIVHQHVARGYWERGIDESGAMRTPPECRSYNGIVGIGTPGGTCATCPLAQFGSNQKTHRGQACKAMLWLYVMPPDRLLPYLLSIAPTGVRAARQHIMQLTAAGMAPWEVITEIGLEKAMNASGTPYVRPTFKVADMVPAEAVPKLEEYAEAFRTYVVGQAEASATFVPDLGDDDDVGSENIGDDATVEGEYTQSDDVEEQDDLPF